MSITATLLTHTQLSDITGYTAFAEAKVGGNGDGNGPPETNAGHDGGSYNSGRVTWDSSPEDGIDTDWRAVQLSDSSGSSENDLAWEVYGCDPGTVTFAGSGSGSVSKVDIRALVQAPGSAAWRSITVDFYKNGLVTDSYTAYTPPAVDESSVTGTVSAEQILEVTSDRTDNDAVIVTGDVRLTCPEGVYPGPDDLAAQVFVFCNSLI